MDNEAIGTGLNRGERSDWQRTFLNTLVSLRSPGGFRFARYASPLVYEYKIRRGDRATTFEFQRNNKGQANMITYGAIRQQVHVVYLPVDDLDDRFVEVVRSMFADWEVRRMDSFRCEDDRTRYVAAHALVRVMLSGLHSTMPAAWTLDQAATGRPFVRGPETAPTIDFSLSHTRGMVGCAAAIGATVGFDVEVLDQGLEVRELAPYVMARAEMGRWAEDRCATSVRQLLCYWTLKEALAKALGVGMTVAPTNLVFDLENDGEATLIGLPELFGPAEEWLVHLAELRGTHVAGVAVNAGACQTVDIHWRCTSAEAVEHSLAMVKERPER